MENNADKPLTTDEFEEIFPFTNFGQFGYGKMDNRVFQQDEYWVDIAGNPHKLEQMPSEYRLNVIMFLRENEKYFFGQTILRTASEVVCDALEGNTNAELMLLGLGVDTIFDLDADEWLNSTPLMRKLCELENL